MRYTKELQEKVCADIKSGLTPSDCAAKYNIPLSIVIKWNSLDIDENKARTIAVRKYQVEVSNCEGRIARSIQPCLANNLSDSVYLKSLEQISSNLYTLVADVVKKERDMNPHEDPPSNGEIIASIVRKWTSNRFIKKYSV